MTTEKRIDDGNLIVNGTFDTTLEGWTAYRVSPAGSRARFDSAGSLSQAVILRGAGFVKVTFDWVQFLCREQRAGMRLVAQVLMIWIL
ncbi:hypothetical protein [Pseudomonas fluorescens]|uniref:hypothetical protein n=1 Tax=Pseudomonas fluorescens TaxID=294 RepID=UPI000A657B76|nr:hypothetical protein [Pseudomonas fluorescens]